MKNEEIKKWFWNKFNSCYPVIHKDYKENIILMYDKNFIRKKKLCRITGEELKYPKEVVGQWLFYLNWKKGHFDCNFDYIWSFLIKNYSPNYMDIRNLIKDMLKEHDKLNVLTPGPPDVPCTLKLKEHDKLNVLTPRYWKVMDHHPLKEYDKLSVLTPKIFTTEKDMQSDSKIK